MLRSKRFISTMLMFMLILSSGSMVFAEEYYSNTLIMDDINEMLGSQYDEYFVAEKPIAKLHEVIQMDRNKLENLMNGVPIYSFWLVEEDREIGLDDTIPFSSMGDATLEIRNSTGLNYQYKVYYLQYESVSPEEDNPEDFDEGVYGPGLGVDGNDPEEAPVDVPVEEPVEVPVEELVDDVYANFSDVPVDSWYHANVMELADRGIINGYEDGSFKPLNSITVVEFMAILNRTANSMDQSFVAPMMNSHLVSNIPDWAMFDVLEVVNRMPESVSQRFDLSSLNRPITRQEVAYFIANTFILPVEVYEVLNEDVFMDLGPDTFFREIEVLVRNEIVNGYPDGTFKPHGHINRAEVSTLINKIFYTGF